MVFDYEAYISGWGQPKASEPEPEQGLEPEPEPEPEPGLEPEPEPEPEPGLEPEPATGGDDSPLFQPIAFVSDSDTAKSTADDVAGLARRAAELGAFGEPVEPKDPKGIDYYLLRHTDQVNFDRVPSRTERNILWRHLLDSGRVFVRDRRPADLAYLYPAARRRASRFLIPNLRIRMRQGTYQGVHGTVIWREDKDPEE